MIKFYFKPHLIKKKKNFFNIQYSNINKIFKLNTIFKFIKNKQTKNNRLINIT